MKTLESPAVLLDRDGVINYNRRDYVRSWADFEFLPGSLGALGELARLGWPVVVVTNQSAVGRGIIGHCRVQEVHRRMVSAIHQAGGRIDTILYCPHHPDDACACRKPRPGLLQAAAQSLGLDLRRSYLVGDSATDIQAAVAAGCQPILVKTGLGAEQMSLLERRPVAGLVVEEDLRAAVHWIFAHAAR